MVKVIFCPVCSLTNEPAHALFVVTTTLAATSATLSYIGATPDEKKELHLKVGKQVKSIRTKLADIIQPKEESTTTTKAKLPAKKSRAKKATVKQVEEVAKTSDVSPKLQVVEKEEVIDDSVDAEALISAL